jgi:transcriptional regulator with XRE-family HTH domain
MTARPCQIPATAVSSRKIFPKLRFSEFKDNFPNFQLRSAKAAGKEEKMDSSENCGIILRQLRKLKGLSVQQTANVIGRSTGWLWEVENGKGRCRLTNTDFEKLIAGLDGNKHRSMFKAWIANHKNYERTNKTFDGAVLKFIRKKKRLPLWEAAGRIGISAGYLSKLESGLKPVQLDMRVRIMKAYGYNPSSFKNLATDPVRSKAVPKSYKFKIISRVLGTEKLDELYDAALAAQTTGEQNV